MCGDRLSRSFVSIGGHVSLAGHIFLFVLLHLERLNAVCKPNQFDTTLEPSLCDVGANLGQQVVIAGCLATEPDVFEGVLLMLVVVTCYR